MSPRDVPSLDVLFHPRSVAVIGASRERGTVGGEVFHNLISCGFPGPVHPVNAGAGVVQSIHAYPSVLDVPGPVDLAVIVVPRAGVLAVVDQCAAKGVKGLVVLSAGFAETGAAGRALQDELLARVRQAGMRLIGPNCLGLLGTDPTCPLNATFAPTWPPSGGVAFSSQSGALGLAILDYARELGIGISEFVSVGNRADVSPNDLLEYWELDERTRIILLYVESFGNPDRFMRLARRISRRKPIVAVKSGRTEAGARAASSHTGSLAGLDVAVDALLGQAGVIRTDTMEALFDVAMLLANQPVPAGPRVAVVTNAGGPGIMAADACETHGLALATLSDATTAALAAFLPPEASLKNPVDMVASAPAASYDRALRLCLDDPGVDAVLVLFVPPVVTEAQAVAAAIRRAGAGAKKPILTCFMGKHGVPEGLSSLREGHYPSYAFPESAAIALAHAVRYGRWRARPEGEVPALSDFDGEAARRVVGPPGRAPRWLAPDEVAALLAACGIAAPPTRRAEDEDAAARAATAVGFPVALKLDAPGITHKTDVGGVVLSLGDEAAVRAAFRQIAARMDAAGRRAEMAGVVVQRMLSGGVEAFAGVTWAKDFPPLIAFGLGGTAVEIWRDVVFRVHPITATDALDMVQGIRGRRLLEGFRGAPRADRGALCDVLLRLSRLQGEVPGIEEIDLNPLLALPEGQGAIALDARVRVT